MTILRSPPRSANRPAGTRWYKFAHPDQAMRPTVPRGHETFAEEQARWERADPAYARICEQARQTKDKGGWAAQRAEQAKAEWDARAATGRQATDDQENAGPGAFGEPAGQRPNQR